MKNLLSISILFCSILGYSQDIHSVVSSAGESFSNTEMQLDYVIGELAVQEVSSSSASVQQGFLQSKDILLSSFSKEELLELGLFPNPSTSGAINISTSHEITKVEVTNLLGKKETFEKSTVVYTRLKGVLVVKVWTTHGVAVKKIEVL